jgi:hypothetical protein
MPNDENKDSLSRTIQKMNLIEKDEIQSLGQTIDAQGNILPTDSMQAKIRNFFGWLTGSAPKRDERPLDPKAQSKRDFLKNMTLASMTPLITITPNLTRAHDESVGLELEMQSRNLFQEFLDFQSDAPITVASESEHKLPEGFPQKWSEINEWALRSLCSPIKGILIEKPIAQFDAERVLTRHQGIDIRAELDQDISCPLDGTYYDGWDTGSHAEENPDGGSGRMSMVESRYPIWTGKDDRGEKVSYHLTIILGHIKKDCKVVNAKGLQIHDGAVVQAGDDAGDIGLTGNTRADEPHLHFEMRIGKKLPEGFGGSPIEFPPDSVPVNPTDIWMYLQQYSETPPPQITTSKADRM